MSGGRMAPTATNLLQLMIGDTVPRPVVRDDGRVGPAVPFGRRVELAGRGTTFVREVAGPRDAPTLLLLHGYMASAGLNWFRAFDTLGQDFRVVAPDARGHARGLRSRRHMRLADCADDMAALIDELDTGPVIAFGVRALNDAYLATVAGVARATGRLATVPAAGANVLRRVRVHRPANFLEW